MFVLDLHCAETDTTSLHPSMYYTRYVVKLAVIHEVQRIANSVPLKCTTVQKIIQTKAHGIFLTQGNQGYPG